jgi:hypothetical protein
VVGTAIEVYSDFSSDPNGEIVTVYKKLPQEIW